MQRSYVFLRAILFLDDTMELKKTALRNIASDLYAIMALFTSKTLFDRHSNNALLSVTVDRI